MCGRFALKAPPAELVTFFGLDVCADFHPRYNIPPGTDIAAIRLSPEGHRVLHLLRWGLIPHWAKDPSIGAKLNNARGESVREKPSFREAFKKRRCLIPADGFYEWQANGKIKQPYYFSLTEGRSLAMAGLWEAWKAPDGSIVRSVCIITTQANTLMAPIHDRMPVILGPEDWSTWLGAPVEAVEPLVKPYAGRDLQAWLVDRRVSRTAEDGEALTEPIVIDDISS